MSTCQGHSQGHSEGQGTVNHDFHLFEDGHHQRYISYEFMPAVIIPVIHYQFTVTKYIVH